MAVVTISASYGAGGSQVGPLVAERLGVDFLDRAIPVAVAERLEVPLADAVAREQPLSGVLDRLLASFAPISGIYGAPPPSSEAFGDRAYAQATEEVIRERCAQGDAVILGRAAALVLAQQPGALHVRLDGPREARLAQAMQREGLDRESASRIMQRTDRAREAYLRHFYGAGARDQSIYHLLIDSTAIDLDSCVQLIVVAAQARAAAAAR